MTNTITDIDGREYVVREVRDTEHFFPVYLGRPVGEPGPAGATVILTRDLADYILSHRRDRIDSLALPIGTGAIKALRCRLGINRQADARHWWDSRADDLRTLTLTEFASRHGVSIAAASREHSRRFGRINRHDGWWSSGPTAEILLRDVSAADAAEQLGVAEGTVRSRRAALKRIGRQISTDARERMARTKRGKPAHPNTAKALRRAAKRRKGKAHRRAIGESNSRAWAEGRHKPPPNAWRPREDRLLGQTIDGVIARLLGRSVAAVRERRYRLGLPMSRHARLRSQPKPQGG